MYSYVFWFDVLRLRGDDNNARFARYMNKTQMAFDLTQVFFLANIAVLCSECLSDKGCIFLNFCKGNIIEEVRRVSKDLNIKIADKVLLKISFLYLDLVVTHK